MTFVSAAPPLFVRNARIAFGDRVVASDLTLEFAAGRTTCLLGRSGVGKTSLLRWLAGLLPGTPHASQAVAYMAQSDLLLPWLPVLDNVLLGYRLRGDAAALVAAGPRARALLAEVGLHDRLDDLPHDPVRRHAPARGARPHAVRGPAGGPDGRAVRPSRCRDAARAAGSGRAAARRPYRRAGDPRSARSAAPRPSGPRAVGPALRRPGRRSSRRARCRAIRPIRRCSRCRRVSSPSCAGAPHEAADHRPWPARGLGSAGLGDRRADLHPAAAVARGRW